MSNLKAVAVDNVLYVTGKDNASAIQAERAKKAADAPFVPWGSLPVPMPPANAPKPSVDPTQKEQKPTSNPARKVDK